MRRTIVAGLTEALLGIAVGYLAYRAIGESDPIGATLGIMLGLLTAVFAAQIVSQVDRASEKRDLQDRLDTVLAKVGDRLADSVEVSQLLRTGRVRYSRSEVGGAWLKLLWATRQRYWTTSYLKPSELGVHTLGLEIQAAKVKADGIDLRRVYIMESEDERRELHDLIAAQKATGADVRYVTRTVLERDPILSDSINSLPSLDLGLFDSRLMLALDLDGDRRLIEGEVTFDETSCAELEAIFRDLFNKAAPL